MSYKNFEEYIEKNYIYEIKEKIKIWIEENKIEKGSQNYLINEIKVLNVRFVKSNIDKIEFDVKLKMEYTITTVFNEQTIFQSEETNFLYRMYGTFEDGFKGKEKKVEEIEEGKDEKLTSGLVPIINSNDLDKYATKFLKEFCPKALKEPTKLNIKALLESKKIKWHYAPMNNNISGITYFAKDKAKVYTSSFKVEEIDVEPGTILVNLENRLKRKEGAFRNTIIHECVHWFFHRYYFQLRLFLNNELTSFPSYKNNSYIKNDLDIFWMEWQARNLAPRILMPKKMVIKKFNEIIDEVEIGIKEGTIKKTTQPKIYELIIKRFANFFGVSILSARIRLKELGLNFVEGILSYIDGGYIKSFSFKKETLRNNQSYTIPTPNLISLINSNQDLQDKLVNESIIYTNKMLVVNDPKYVNNKTYKLTSYALEHAEECCLRFNVQRMGRGLNGEYSEKFFLFSSDEDRKESYSIDEDSQSILYMKAKENASHFEKHKHLLPTTFSKLLEYLYKKNKLFSSYDELGEEADVSGRTIRDYKNEKKEPTRINIIKIALALRLSAPYILHLLNLADQQISFNNKENIILMAVIFENQRKGLEVVYRELKKINEEKILHLSKNYINNHPLK